MSDKPYADAVSVRRPAGFIVLGSEVVADTLQCVHCGAHWISQAGSGIVRGFCRNCMGPVCGPKCAVCVPFERKLDLMERQGR
jgi:hypothetical protein